MKLKPVLLDPTSNSPDSKIQTWVNRRSRALRALYDFTNADAKNHKISLAECCRRVFINPDFVYALRKDPKVKARLDQITELAAQKGMVMAENMMLKRMEQAGQTVLVKDDETGMVMQIDRAPMKPRDEVAFADHFRKVRGGGFVHRDTQPSVLVQVNLPQPIGGYSAPVRAEAKLIAEKEFGDLLGQKDEGEEDE